MGCAHILLLLTLSLLALGVSGQKPPADFKFDCRRTNVGCKNSGLCLIAGGTCDCAAAAGFEGYDCGLQTSGKAAACANLQCENNGVCLNEGACFCNKDTYGAKCENPRVKVWCTDSEMFINIMPHTTPFAGKIYLRNADGTGKSTPECHLTVVDSAATPAVPDLTQYTYVKTDAGATPTLGGFFISQKHEPTDADTGVCQAARKIETEKRIDYIQNVLIEYNSALVSTVDQIINLNCSISKTAEGDPFTSENAMSVSINDDDYQHVNDTEMLVPVDFEIIDPNNDVPVTNFVYLGDPLDLLFTLQTTEGMSGGGTTIKEFMVQECTADKGEEPLTEENSIKFLDAGCPKAGSEMLFRENVEQTDVEDKKQTKIALYAFRFVGLTDVVNFQCILKLCTNETLAENADACKKPACPGESTDDGEGGGENGGEGGGETTAAPDGGVTEAPATEAPATEAPVTAAPGGRRRKRSADDEREVTKTVKVSSPLQAGQTGSDNDEKETEAKKETEDCMQHSEVVIIIAIFVVILVLLVFALVVAVVNLLRSRQKVVDVSDTSSGDTQSRYTLPRLSLATTM